MKLGLVLLIVGFNFSTAYANTIGAITNGNWENGSIWTGSLVPGSSDDVYIGSNSPAGAASIATVALTANESADNLYLGYGSSDSGTLSLGTSTLTVVNSLNIGSSGGIGAITGSGSFTAPTLNISGGNSFTFGASDVVSTLNLTSGSSATTAATGNITAGVSVFGGSTLSLGAPLDLTGTLDMRDTGSVLNLNGHSLTANTVDLGYYDSQTTTTNRGGAGGTISATNLQVGNQTFSLLSTDSVTNYYLNSNATSTLNSNVSGLFLSNGSTATTTSSGNVTSPGSVQVFSGSTLNLGTAMNLGASGTFDMRDTGSVLNLNGNSLSAGTIYLGYFDSQTTTTNRGGVGGTISATNLEVGNQTFTLLSTDSATNFYLNNATSTLNSNVSGLFLSNGSSATTTASGNVTSPGSVQVFSGSTLNLGTAMNLGATGTFDMRDTGSVLNLNGNSLSAGTIYLGYFDSQTTTTNRGGPGGTISATNLEVGNQTFNLLSTDSATNFYLNNATSTLNSNVSGLFLSNGSSATTTASGNVTSPGSVQVFSGSTLNLGAAMNLGTTGTFDMRDTGSVLNMNGHSLTAGTIYLGWFDSQATTTNRGGAGGTITATNLQVGNQTFNLLSTDSVTNFFLSNSTSTLNSNVSGLFLSNGSNATTTASGNVTSPGSVEVWTGSTLNLGTAMNLGATGTFDMRDTGSILNLNDNGLSAGTIYLGWFDSEPTTVNRGGSGGTLTATNLLIGNQTFSLQSGDSTANLTLANATVTTAATGNVIGSVLVEGANTTTGPSTLNLGAAMTLSGNVDVRDNSILNLEGLSLSADTIYDGYFDTEAGNIINDGGIQADDLYVGNGSSLTLIPNDTLSDLLFITGNSTVTVDQGVGQLTGLTLNGTSASDLVLDPSVFALDFSSQTSANWIFRWLDPGAGENWISTLNTLISDGSIVINAPNGYSVTDDGTYTYIQGGVAVVSGVPEPTSSALMGLGILVLVLMIHRRRKLGQRKTY